MQSRRTRTTRVDYQMKRREEKLIHKAKKYYRNKQLQEIENLHRDQECRKFYRKVNFTREDFKPRITSCRSIQGNLLNSREEVLEHFKTILGDQQDGSDVEDNKDVGETPYSEEEQELAMLEEVRQAVKKLANNKAPGSDAITAGGEILFGGLRKLFLKVWEDRRFPDEWNLSII
jgi:hypothetical protein